MGLRRSVYKHIGLLPRPWKRMAMVGMDLVVLPACVYLAYALRFGDVTPGVRDIWWLFIFTPLLTVPIFWVLGLYRAIVRYMGSQAVFAVIKGVSISALLLAAVALFGNERGLPRSVVLIYWIVALLAVGAPRFFVRTYLTSMARRFRRKQRVIIYGAGMAGIQSAAALMNGNEYEPVAFVDDDASLVGNLMNGVRVYSPRDLEVIADRFRASYVLLAMPSASRGRRRQIIRTLEPLPVHVKTLPGLSDLVSGQARVDDFRDVDIEDLLGRDPVTPDRALLEAGISGKTVLVTGAGGSIGSELCRQIVRLAPTRLLLLEVSEYGLYGVERELKALAQRDELNVDVVALLGSIGQRRRLQRIMRSFGVDTVYHAAAYKHVPMVESNIIEGVRNNVFGTLRCGEAAIEAGVSSFVLISTDKAVRPTNVMGATKRLAEMVLQGLAGAQPTTRFTMVRFGNVLGSSGSVVPLFREQVRQGGPVTVTHAEVIRYFMTIPEASELVLQAGALGEGGDVFVLDMGEPVKILDLARRMIHLMGQEVRDEDNPNGDVEIAFTGLRPGEKLYEELLIGDNVLPTGHPMILRAQEEAIGWEALQGYLQPLDQACRDFDCARIRKLLEETVSGYSATGAISDLLWNHEKVPVLLPDKSTKEAPGVTRLY